MNIAANSKYIHCFPGTTVGCKFAYIEGKKKLKKETDQTGRWQFNKEGFPHNSVGKSSACNTGDPGLIPGSGRSPGEGNGNPIQYSRLENPMDRGSQESDTA